MKYFITVLMLLAFSSVMAAPLTGGLGYINGAAATSNSGSNVAGGTVAIGDGAATQASAAQAGNYSIGSSVQGLGVNTAGTVSESYAVQGGVVKSNGSAAGINGSASGANGGAIAGGIQGILVLF